VYVVLPLSLGLIGFIVVSMVAALSDPVGWGYLLSTHVESVAKARLAEPVFGLPPLYFLAAMLAGAGVIAGLPGIPVWVRWAAGVFVGTFVLVTLWDLRRRRGTLAVYIMLRRKEIGFEPKGSVIEVPKLMFLVMNQPTPAVWLLAAVGLVIAAGVALPYDSWLALVPAVTLALLAALQWWRHRRSAWEPLARRLRRASLLSGDRLVEHLEHALDLDPEVVMVRHEADSMVARLMGGQH
jgi:membrane protein implicated in regulation of membrane protease activity